MHRARIGSLMSLAALAVGCAATSPTPGVDPTEGMGGSGGAPPTAGGQGGTLDDFGSGGGEATDCPPESQLVYVVDYQQTIYELDPTTVTFTEIGVVDCSSGPIFSMAVSRDAVAWAHAIDGTMVRYDIAAQSCEPIPFAKAQHGFLNFGMGFSSDAPGGAHDTLFVASNTNLGLATIDTESLVLDPVGPYDALAGRAELTGTGDAQLFGAFEGTPYVVAEIAKTSAEILSQAPQGPVVVPPGGSNFAFAFWGGDFWLFVGPGGDATNVYQYRPSDGTTTLVGQAGFQIVGAGVSTCAPTVPPVR